MDVFGFTADATSKANNAQAQVIGVGRGWGDLMLNYNGQKWSHEIAELKYMLEVFQSGTNALSTWNNTWGEVFDNLAKGIGLNSAAHEAAQTPALRLWNASVGLNQAATGVLVALSGQGTRTTTTRQNSGSGEFWSGLFGSAISGITGGLAEHFSAEAPALCNKGVF